MAIPRKSDFLANSLCWQCKKACPGQGCCWIDEKPSGKVSVPGWQTIKREVVQGRGKGIVQIVQACPQFEEG